VVCPCSYHIARSAAVAALLRSRAWCAGHACTDLQASHAQCHCLSLPPFVQLPGRVAAGLPMSFATAERPIQQAVFLSRPSCSSLGVSQLVCLGGFNNTRQEFEVRAGT